MTTTAPRPDPCTGSGPDPDSGPDDPRTTLRLGHPRELLAIVPHLLGFAPRDFAVLVALRPPGRRLGLVARVDLRDLTAPGGPRFADTLAARLREDGATEVVVVLYTGEGDPRDPERGLRAGGSSAAHAAEVLRSAVAGLGPVTVWSVDGGSYVGLDCRDRACCPVGGRPLADLSGGELAGRLVARRGGVAGSREELGLVRSAAPGPRRSAAAARSRWLDVLLRVDGPDALLRWRRRSLAAWGSALGDVGGPDGPPLPPAALGRLEAALLDPVLRDAVVLTLVAPDDTALPDALLRTGSAGADGPGWVGADGAEDCPGGEGCTCGDDLSRDGDRKLGEDRPRGGDCADGGDCGGGEDCAGRGDSPGDDRTCAARTVCACAPGAAVPAPDVPGPDVPDPDAAAVSARVRAALDLLVDPVRGREPREDVVAAGRAVLEAVVAHGRRDRQAPALTVLALLAWWDGDAVRASVLVERALDQDPGHRLAELLDRALGAGLPPGWVRRRC